MLFEAYYGLREMQIVFLGFEDKWGDTQKFKELNASKMASKEEEKKKQARIIS